MNWLKLSRRPVTHAQAWMSSRHLTVNINRRVYGENLLQPKDCSRFFVEVFK